MRIFVSKPLIFFSYESHPIYFIEFNNSKHILNHVFSVIVGSTWNHFIDHSKILELARLFEGNNLKSSNPFCIAMVLSACARTLTSNRALIFVVVTTCTVLLASFFFSITSS